MMGVKDADRDDGAVPPELGSYEDFIEGSGLNAQGFDSREGRVLQLSARRRRTIRITTTSSSSTINRGNLEDLGEPFMSSRTTSADQGNTLQLLYSHELFMSRAMFTIGEHGGPLARYARLRPAPPLRVLRPPPRIRHGEPVATRRLASEVRQAVACVVKLNEDSLTSRSATASALAIATSAA